MDDLTPRERLAIRILAAMFRIAAPDRKHSFKNDEAIAFVMGEKDQ